MIKNYTCNFCNKKLDTLSHKCKYCGEIHCSEHLLPEVHNCQGLSIPENWNLKNNNYKGSEIKQEDNFVRRKRSIWNILKVKFIRMSIFSKSLIFAILTYLLATYFSTNIFFILLEIGAWIFFSIILYWKVFKWINGINMGNDLSFFCLRILGGGIVLIGFCYGVSILYTSIFYNNTSLINIPILTLLVGLIILGFFIAFRTGRRYNITGIWNAQ